MADFSLDTITGDVNQSLKKFTPNKGTLLLIGVGLIVLYVLFRQRSPVAQTDIEPETIPDVELAGYPTMNPADLEDTFGNYQSVILGEVQGTLNDYHSDIMDQINEVREENQSYVDAVREGLEKEIGTDPATVEKKNSASWTIGNGVHGEGNPNSNIDLSKNRQALKEEIDRTLSVIQYRESKGLATNDQEIYLNKIRKL